MRDVGVAAGTEIRRLLGAACAAYGARVALVITDAGDLIDGVQQREDGAILDLTTSGAIASGLYAAGNQLATLLGDPDLGSVLQQDDGAQHLVLRLESGVALVLEVPPHRPLATLRHAGRQMASAMRAALLLIDPVEPMVDLSSAIVSQTPSRYAPGARPIDAPMEGLDDPDAPPVYDASEPVITNGTAASRASDSALDRLFGL